MANFMTCLRIALSIALLFCPVFGALFYALYIAAGATDMLDGMIARRTGTVSALGSRLDTAADIVFAAVCLIRLIPVMDMEPWMYIWTAVIAAIKAASIIWGFARRKRLTAVHSFMNRAAGIMLFVLPLTLELVELRYSAFAVCAAATVAAVQEAYIVMTGKETETRE